MQPAHEFYAGRAVCKACTRLERKRHRQTMTLEQRDMRAASQQEYRERHRERVRETNRRSAERQRARDPEGFAERQRVASRATSARRRALIHEAKSRPCADCGLSFHPVAMDLHHREPDQKEFNVSQMATKTPAVILAEIAKCDVLCSNCHRIRHWKERQNVPASVE